MKAQKNIIICIAVLLVAMFIYALEVQLLHFEKFVLDVNNQPFPNDLTTVLVVVLLGIEFLIIVLLLFNRTRLKGFYLSTILLGILNLYIVLIQLNVFEYVPCSCASIIENITWWQQFFFNLFFLLISVAGILLQNRHGLKHKTNYNPII